MGELNETSSFAEDRKYKIAEYVKRKGRVGVGELCDEFSVSRATMRNDLQVLHERGMLKRTHGGAMAITQTNFEPSTDEKFEKFLKEKQMIARSALKYIHEGDSIALDAGTTTMELAKLLGQFKKLRVVTYDLSIAAYLDNNTQASLFLAGGELRRGHHYMIGTTPLDSLRKIHVDTFFVAANGVDLETGITTPQLETAIIKELLIRNARRSVVLADSSKLDNVSFARFAGLQDIDTLITDNGGDREFLALLEERGVKIDVAGEEQTRAQIDYNVIKM